MNGGTLRFWEAQFHVEMPLTGNSPNVVYTPHDWPASNIYALFNLYELTGDQLYLEHGMNAMFMPRSRYCWSPVSSYRLNSA